MPSGGNVRLDATGHNDRIYLNSVAVDGTSGAVTGSSSTYSISEYSTFDMLITVSSYTGSGNIVVTAYPSMDATGTEAAAHATTSGNLSANGRTHKTLGQINTPYLKLGYSVASSASATIKATISGKVS